LDPGETVGLPGTSLTWGRFRVVWKADRDQVSPPDPGVAFRGALGKAFHKIACSCPHKAVSHGPACSYAAVFETPVPKGVVFRTGSDRAPHPFVLSTGSVPAGRLLREGDRVAVDLTLVGKGCGYLPYFVLALRAVGQAGIPPSGGPLSLASVHQLRGMRWTSIYDRATGVLTPRKFAVGPPEEPALKADRWLLATRTPLCLRRAGREILHPRFADVVAVAARRLNQLTAVHQPEVVPFDFRHLLPLAGRVEWRELWSRRVSTSRRSAGQGQEMPLAGILAAFEAKGDLSPFAPLMRWASLLHLGRHTAFGLGEIEIA
jgi:hypothetical protein